VSALRRPVPTGAAGVGRFAQQRKGLCGKLAATAAAGGFDQLDQREGREPQLMWVGGGLRGRGEGVLVAGQAVVERGGHPLRDRESHPLAAGHEVLGAGPHQPCDLILAAPKGGLGEGPVGGTMRPSVASERVSASWTSDAAAPSSPAKMWTPPGC
jgi:hypothetical protein